MELQHFSHEHPLIFEQEEQFYDDDGNIRRRNGCLEPLFSSPSYSCSQCNFFLDKFCAELPRDHINHPLYPHHLLTLLAHSSFRCDSYWRNLNYSCSLCDYDLDPVCAYLSDRRFEHPSHKHSLTWMRGPVLSFCDGCGTKHEGIFYLCNTCPKSFLIHQDCATLKIKINCTDHQEHPLTLSYSTPPQYSVFKNYCDICTKEVDDKYAFYYCGECRYFAHVHCATSKYEPFMSILIPWSKAEVKVKVEDPCPSVVQLPVPDESVSLISLFGQSGIMGSGQREGEGGGSTVVDQLKHFSHDHPLTLSNYKRGMTPVNCVTKPITTAALFYRCIDQCNFFLHKCCAELPIEVQHPGHPQHLLMLLPRSHTLLGVFMCSACDLYCNGFCYKCEYCVDVQCSSLPMSIKHEAHKEHVLSSKASISMRCCASGVGRVSASTFAYHCDKLCNFELLPFHAQLPREIRHRYDELHPFVLTYSPVKGTHHWGEYICDICETELDPRLWFYHCVDCDHSMHIRCIPQFDRWSRLKFGGTFTIDRHSHPLTFVPVIRPNIIFHKFCHVITTGTRCDSIGECIGMFRSFSLPFALKFLECNFKLHHKCASRNQDSDILGQ